MNKLKQIIYGKCDKCEQSYTFKEKWCNDCDTKDFLEKTRAVGYHKNLDELSKDEKRRFKKYGICNSCLQIKAGHRCNDDCQIFNVIQYGTCHQCNQRFTHKTWCNNCNTKISLNDELSKY